LYYEKENSDKEMNCFRNDDKILLEWYKKIGERKKVHFIKIKNENGNRKKNTHRTHKQKRGKGEKSREKQKFLIVNKIKKKFTHEKRN